MLKLFIKTSILYKTSSLPFSALSIFGAKPPSSPTFVASRPYSALILKISLYNNFKKHHLSHTNFLNDDTLLNPFA
jgi:hypothetical protein